MLKRLETVCVLSLVLTGACRAPRGASWSQGDALAAESVELEMNATGGVVAIEYHVTPELVPESIHAAMNALHPGGRVVAGEREMVGGELFWELSKEIDGREVEVMFRLDGTLASEELEVAANDVPETARTAVEALMDGRITTWEEIRDGERNLVEYHAKIEASGRRFKVAVGADGAVRSVAREIPAEIEVPVPMTGR